MLIEIIQLLMERHACRWDWKTYGPHSQIIPGNLLNSPTTLWPGLTKLGYRHYLMLMSYCTWCSSQHPTGPHPSPSQNHHAKFLHYKYTFILIMSIILTLNFMRGPYWAHELLLEGKTIQKEDARKVSLCLSWYFLGNGDDPIPIWNDGHSQ